MKEGDACPKCCEGKLWKPQVFYSVFEGKKQPDFICDKCGAPSFQKLPEVEPLPSPKEKETKKIKKQEKFDWTRYI